MGMVRVERLDHLGLIAAVINDLGLVSIIDARLTPDEQEAITPGEAIKGMILNGLADIEQPLTQRNLVNLAHILPKQSKDVDLHLVETFNEVVHLTVYAHPD